MCRHGTKQAILIFELGKNRVICEWKTHRGLWRANHHSLFSGPGSWAVIIKMFIYFQIQMFVWSCMLKLQLLIVLLQLSQVTWWLTKKKSCILLFLPGSSLCEESQLRLLCLLWKKLSYVKQKDSCQRTPGPCACVCEWARRPLLWAYIAVNEIAGLSHSHVLCVENTFY